MFALGCGFVPFAVEQAVRPARPAAATYAIMSFFINPILPPARNLQPCGNYEMGC
jgi:hypothetical protein